MKLQVTIKDPDALYEAARDRVRYELRMAVELGALSEREVDKLEEDRISAITDKLKSWVKHGEYYRIEFDTDAMTATVLER